MGGGGREGRKGREGGGPALLFRTRTVVYHFLSVKMCINLEALLAMHMQRAPTIEWDYNRI